MQLQCEWDYIRTIARVLSARFFLRFPDPMMKCYLVWCSAAQGARRLLCVFAYNFTTFMLYCAPACSHAFVIRLSVAGCIFAQIEKSSCGTTLCVLHDVAKAAAAARNNGGAGDDYNDGDDDDEQYEVETVDVRFYPLSERLHAAPAELDAMYAAFCDGVRLAPDTDALNDAAADDDDGRVDHSRDAARLAAWDAKLVDGDGPANGDGEDSDDFADAD